MKDKLKRSLPLLIWMMFLCSLFPMSAAASSGASLNRSSVILAKGESFSLKVSNADKGTIRWKSSKSSVASVDKKGKIKAKKAGKATITASVYGVEKTCSVTVKSSKKSAALANYKAFLERERIPWGPDYYEGSILTAHCGFQLIYIDNDSIPELALDSRIIDENDNVFHSTGYSQIFCYRNGSVHNISSGDRHQYYPQKGVYVSVYANHGWKTKSYYKLSKGRTQSLFSSSIRISEEASGVGDEYYYDSNNNGIDKATFKKLRKKAVDTTKRKDVDEEKSHPNTKKNRKKYLS